MPSATAPVTRRLYRHREDRMVAGVASGLADHLGIDVKLLRAGFVATVLLGGFGVVLYAAFWAVVPQSSDDPRHPGSASSRPQLVGFVLLGLTMLLIAQLLGFGPGLLWPAAAAITGAAILWRQADETQRLRWRSVTARQSRLIAEDPGQHAWLRYGAGLLLVVAGMASFLAAHDALTEVRRAALPVLVVVLGLVLAIGPWMLQTFHQLTDERTARIREHERVEIAGRVHDSMLQTLTLIQRRVDEPDEVLRLVRRSERELRGWLYTPAVPESLRAAIRSVIADAEDSYAVTIDLVMVGEATTTPAVDALLAAARESVVNAAKHSGAAKVSVYVEAEPEQVTVFVRDRGHGFAVEEIPADRFGVRESVIARMQRHGGETEIRSTPANGTEVRLRIPLPAGRDA